jgi:hypothetical protein
MRVTEVSATVRYSAEAKGAWRSVELGAEATLTNSDETLETAQQELYHRLSSQLKALWANGNGKADHQEGHRIDVQPSSAQRSSDASQHYNEHFCQEHNQEFKKRNGPHGEFYLHQVKGSKAWCNEARSNPERRLTTPGTRKSLLKHHRK